MIGVGIVVFLGGAAIFALGVIAEMNHPTGGDDVTSSTIHDGVVVAAVGLVLILLGAVW